MNSQQVISSLVFVVLIVGINAGLEKLDSNTKSSYDMVGHRLKRSTNEEITPGVYYNKDDLHAIAKFIQENPWILANMPDMQKRQMYFTPRLGRDLSEENSNSDMFNSGDFKSLRSLQFVPRLGRQLRGHRFY